MQKFFFSQLHNYERSPLRDIFAEKKKTDLKSKKIIQIFEK